ncbi:hypothetical protein ACJX0J_009033, partial [Zea mays]
MAWHKIGAVSLSLRSLLFGFFHHSFKVFYSRKKINGQEDKIDVFLRLLIAGYGLLNYRYKEETLH